MPYTQGAPLDLSHMCPSSGAYLPFIPPLGTPRVFHDPVEYSILLSIANSQDCMVDLIWSFMTGSAGNGNEFTVVCSVGRVKARTVTNKGSLVIVERCFPLDRGWYVGCQSSMVQS